MVQLFLRAKHWQLFLPAFGVPLIFQFVLIGSLLSGISTEQGPNIELISSSFKFYPLIMLLFAGTLMGWLWSIGTGLDKKIPDGLKLKVGRFKVLLLLPLGYILFLSIAIGMFVSNMFSPEYEPDMRIFGWIIPLHLFSMFCIFYALYFVAKTIKTAELQRKVRTGDVIGDFFLVWFFPVGIWLLQPRINKLVAT